MKRPCTVVLLGLSVLAIQALSLCATSLPTHLHPDSHKTENLPAVPSWEVSFQNGYLLNKDHRTRLIPYRQTQQLREDSQILVDPTPLLPLFRIAVTENEPLEDVLNRIIPDFRRYISPQELMVIVVKRNAIQRLRIGSVREGTTVTAEKTENSRINPGEILIFERMGY